MPSSLPYSPGNQAGQVGRVPQPLALPLTSCSPTQSWFLAEREPEERMEMSPHLRFQMSQLGGDGKLTCLPSPRDHLASFRGPNSHLGVHVCACVYIPLF